MWTSRTPSCSSYKMLTIINKAACWEICRSALNYIALEDLGIGGDISNAEFAKCVRDGDGCFLQAMSDAGFERLTVRNLAITRITSKCGNNFSLRSPIKTLLETVTTSSIYSKTRSHHRT